jgi:hypothetical protein
VHDATGAWPTTPEEIAAFEAKVTARWRTSIDSIHADVMAWQAAHPNV